MKWKELVEQRLQQTQDELDSAQNTIMMYGPANHDQRAAINRAIGNIETLAVNRYIYGKLLSEIDE